MKVTIIRHGKVNMQWQKSYNSEGFDSDCKRYDELHIFPIIEKCTDDSQVIYISELMRTYETAKYLFGEKEFLKNNLLNEVPLKSFMDSRFKLPTWLWNLAGRLQWLFNSSRQLETKKETIKRADLLILLLEERQEDCVLVTHGFFMRTLIGEFKKKGYKVTKKNGFGISNLDRIVVEI